MGVSVQGLKVTPSSIWPPPRSSVAPAKWSPADVKIPERVKDRPEVEVVTRACALGNGPQYLSQLCEEGGVREAVNCVELGSRGRIAERIR